MKSVRTIVHIIKTRALVGVLDHVNIVDSGVGGVVLEPGFFEFKLLPHGVGGVDEHASALVMGDVFAQLLVPRFLRDGLEDAHHPDVVVLGVNI